MDREELRLEILRLINPRLDRPDVNAWIETAKQLEAYICQVAGHPSADDPAKTAVAAPLKAPNNPRVAGRASRVSHE
jgi:hypothetical protein